MTYSLTQLLLTYLGALLPIIQCKFPNVADIQVTGFKNGSVLATYNIVVKNNVPKDSVTASQLGSLVKTSLALGNLSSINADDTFVLTVKGKHHALQLYNFQPLFLTLFHHF